MEDRFAKNQYFNDETLKTRDETPFKTSWEVLQYLHANPAVGHLLPSEAQMVSRDVLGGTPFQTSRQLAIAFNNASAADRVKNWGAPAEAQTGSVRDPFEPNRILGTVTTELRLPHPDASNQALGPNLGGEDAIQDRPATSPGPASGGASAGFGFGGILLIGAALLGLTLIARRK